MSERAGPVDLDRQSSPTRSIGAALAPHIATRRTTVLLTVLALSLASALFVFMLSWAAENAVAQNAKRVSIAWAQFFGGNFDDLSSKLVPGGDFSAQIAVFERTREFADVFRIKLFDGEGRLLMISDEKVANADARSLDDHNPKAATVIRDGQPIAFVEDGRAKPNRPDVYVESYVPLMQNGAVIGVAEVYLDQTRDAANIRASYFTFGAEVGALVLFVLAFPLAGLLLAQRSLKARNSELIAARDAAQLAEKSKSAFLATMSHELRTPMNGVIGFANLLSESDLNGLQREFVDTIRNSGETLLSLLNDILDFSKIDAGKIELEEAELAPEMVIDGILDLLGPNAYAKGLELSCYIEPQMPAFLIGDASRVRQILFNLAGNAVKFTSKGAVSIEVTRHNQTYEVAVSDTGIGIPADKLDTIFENFTQADSTTSRRYGGTGLGLAISRRLAELMHGSLDAESVVDQGSVFRLRLPLRETEPPAETVAQEARVDLARRRILAVDDNETNLRIFALMLDGFGARTTTATDAHAAMSLLLAATRDGDPFEVAIIDHMMPDIDGVALAVMIRSEPRLADLRLILSSSAHLEAGTDVDDGAFDDRCPKPIRQAQLLHSVDRALNANRASAPAPAMPKPAADPAPETKPASNTATRILVAEDNPTNQRLMAMILQSMGLDHDLVSDGAQAVQRATIYPYDLLLLDISMPEMGGIEATQRIRATRGRCTDVPIIAITANALKGDRENYLAAGMDDYIAKPIDAAELQRKIHHWLESRRAPAARTGT
ncbi:MAG: response regulator [Alphaproteobacteria bacterium]